MRDSTLIFCQPHTKDCVMKLSGGMTQIPLHAKFSGFGLFYRLTLIPQPIHPQKPL